MSYISAFNKSSKVRCDAKNILKYMKYMKVNNMKTDTSILHCL